MIHECHWRTQALGGDLRRLGFGLLPAEIESSPSGEPFSVLIPERGRPDLLAGTLKALGTALEGLETPYETCVLVNGARRNQYEVLVRAFPWVQWHFAKRALGFHGAMRHLLTRARHPWVYLLNSD